VAPGDSSSVLRLTSADTATVDWLLKIGHFPALRDYFYDSWLRFLDQKAPEWEDLARKGFAVFDYELSMERLSARSGENDVNNDEKDVITLPKFGQDCLGFESVKDSWRSEDLQMDEVDTLSFDFI
jgi:hypothetical protein